ncbi:SRPBCC family protein [Marinicellulosiphila megalodicopiae]|uniref:SRPBCC family protein n=1 Tax=Marinicellulosiphila megalodicopiae TaxID=2724896 RepID=UPI003BB1E931
MFDVKLTLERTMVIDAPVSEVFKIVSDFNTWRTWSPWLCQEPTCPVVVQLPPYEVGHAQHWTGTHIGSGNMHITNIVENKRIDYDLEFLKPWKSSSKTSFDFKQIEGQCHITWAMDSSLPFFMFWMKNMMIALIGNDYIRGLTMLKELAENKTVHSSIEIQENIKVPAMYYIGIEKQCDVKDIGQVMSEDFDTLHGMIESKSIPQPSKVIAIYKKFDLAKGRCHFISALAFDEYIAFSDPKFTQGTIATHQAFAIKHTGDYKFVGNAWATAMGMLRYKKIKQFKKIHPYEVYVNSPKDTEAKDLMTNICFPIK